jgi:general secretion pathway protein L
MAAIADPTSFKRSRSPRRLARRLRIPGFLRWWRRELAAAMPERIRAAFERRRARPVLAFDGSTATLWRPAQANGRLSMREAARIGLDGDPQAVAAAGRGALAPLAVATGAPPWIIVALSPRASLRKTLTLPTALEEHLHQSLAYDLDRHTPFKPEELYFDAVVVDRDSARNMLRVDLAAARRSLVDTALRQAESFGARVVRVTVDPPATASSSPINLLPHDRRLGTRSWTRWQVALPAALLLVGILAALFLPIWQKREQVIALLEVTSQARDRATVSDALRSQLERRIGDYNFALERKYAFPGAVQVLEDVTRILPDDTWLTQFELHAMRGKDAEREITLRGESANAGRLVSLLEDSKLFTQAAPRSPTTKIQPGPGEIFDVSAHLKPTPQPTPLPIEMLPPIAAPAPVAAPAPPAAPAAPKATRAAPSAAAKKPEPAGGPAPAPQPAASAPSTPGGLAPGAAAPAQGPVTGDSAPGATLPPLAAPEGEAPPPSEENGE